MKFDIGNLVLAAALLLAGGKGAMAFDCEVLQCFQDHGDNLPIHQTVPFCHSDDMYIGPEGGQQTCRCFKDACSLFKSRCEGRGWRVHTLGGCVCTGPSAC
ncbi:uncharacterized protein B0H64DRAFT_413030 [Chaetomium fimeti]|uniref:Uncharacterized protein n=1 Tax=Chaetomium fimeti TaxID=1854472 RepID=A0AAE0LM58_9PEZI|nr:hypothetical protein B0H64DRAFT_413030 [Chaetomium fimeti]